MESKCRLNAIMADQPHYQHNAVHSFIAVAAQDTRGIEAATRRQNPSTIPHLSSDRAGSGTIRAGSALSQRFPANQLESGGAYARFRSLGGAYVHILKRIDENCAFVDCH
jgi:hypothetical protein